MTAKAKIVNYTAAQTAELVEAYNMSVTEELRDETMAHYAKLWGKNVASIRSKLVREKVYIAKAKVTGKRNGNTKDSLANAIGAVAQMTENDTTSLTKANMGALEKLWMLVREATEEVGENASS